MADLTGMMQAAAGAGEDAVFVEDVFSTYLYTGTGAAQTITNGIDLDGEGGLTWIKGRSGTTGHRLTDTVRGATKSLASNSSDAEATESTGLTAFGSTGFTIGADADYNTSAATYCSWTFREQPKFFDIVTWVGTGVTNRMIPHNLGSTPGCIIVRRVDDSADWYVWHRSLTSGNELKLNDTGAEGNFVGANGFTTVNATEFSTDDGSMNASSYTFIAYLFAHDAGGFGTAGSDNVISCGSYTGAASDVSVSLGYEPQYLLIKNASSTTNWYMVDIMRGLYGTTTPESYLYPNSSNAEATDSNRVTITSTGFIARAGTTTINDTGNTYIYIAIRRGPMKTPTSGTSVFAPVLSTVSTGTQRTIGFPADATFSKTTINGAAGWGVEDRLRGYARTNNTGQSPALAFNTTAAEDSSNLPVVMQVFNTTYLEAGSLDGNAAVIQSFGRAPGFMDVVCYTGTGANRTVTHNLGVVPELMIVKNRSDATGRAWAVYAGDNTDYLVLNTTAATADDNTYWNDTSPTSSVFSVGTNNSTNESSDTFVAYLFATVAGVSKVGSYTGNGTSVTVTTGFQPRYILVKRTDSTGNWIQGDSARGLVAGNDPALFLNTTAAETTGQDWVDVSATGFTVNETALNANVSTATYIFLAIS